MPIKIPNNLPAFSTLVNENIFVMADEKASRQDIRPLKVAIVNLMPTKIVTETQLLRLLSNTPLFILHIRNGIKLRRRIENRFIRNEQSNIMLLRF